MDQMPGYTLDAVAGVVTFGDGVHGAEVPEGFRNVRAVSYRVGGGKAGAVQADAISTLLSSVAFVTKVTNPWPATGGADMRSALRLLSAGPRRFALGGAR